MRSVRAFLSLIRWPNLLFIVLTQCLFYFLVTASILGNTFTPGQDINFYLLVLASVLISAAGYIINDYFDVQIDAINKPARLIVGKKIKRRWAIVWHMFLSLVGLALSIYVSISIGSPLIGIVNFACILLLWIYSVSLKRSLLVGNFSIAALTAWVILVIYFFVIKEFKSISEVQVHKLFKYTVLYASFAFIVTLIREVVKDIEDMEGDRKYNSHTLPIVWGVPAAKLFTAVWIMVCIGMLAVVSVYALVLGLWFISLYSICLLVLPLIFLLRRLYAAKLSSDYRDMSMYIKLIMLAGILSMLIFLFNVFST